MKGQVKAPRGKGVHELVQKIVLEAESEEDQKILAALGKKLVDAVGRSELIADAVARMAGCKPRK